MIKNNELSVLDVCELAAVTGGESEGGGWQDFGSPEWFARFGRQPDAQAPTQPPRFAPVPGGNVGSSGTWLFAPTEFGNG